MPLLRLRKCRLARRRRSPGRCVFAAHVGEQRSKIALSRVAPFLIEKAAWRHDSKSWVQIEVQKSKARDIAGLPSLRGGATRAVYRDIVGV